VKQTVQGTLFILEMNSLDSSFISQVVYDAKTEILSVVLKNDSTYNYKDFPLETFVEFSVAKSFGGFYNSEIKNKFKKLNSTKMAEKNGNQPNRINKAGDFKRYIRMSIDVTKLNKDWFYVSKNEDGSVKAVYAKVTLVMQPDGVVDKYGSLGFIVQEIPKEVAKENKDLKGPILGNGEELEWKREEEKVERVTDSEEADDIMEGLPF